MENLFFGDCRYLFIEKRQVNEKERHTPNCSPFQRMMWNESTCPNGGQIPISFFDSLLAFLFRHAGNVGDEGRDAWMMLKEISMDIEEAPTERIPHLILRTLGIVPNPVSIHCEQVSYGVSSTRYRIP